jgi:CheY-like chemotaxis protein
MKSIFAPFCGVVEARDGQEALDMCRKSRPDLIITDVMMPVVRLSYTFANSAQYLA